MAIQIVTGRTGEPHLDIYEVSELLRDIFGVNSENNIQVLIFNSSNALSLSTDGNSVIVSAGDFLMQGAFMRVPVGQTVTATGTLSNNANQAILYIHYEQDVTTGIDSAEFGIYNGSYTDFKNEYPSSYLETASKEIYAAIYAIEYSNTGDQSTITEKQLTPESASAYSLEKFKDFFQNISDRIIEHETKFKIQRSGVANFLSVRAGQYYNHNIDLSGRGFREAPKISLTPVSSVPDKIHLSVKNCTKNGFTIVLKRDDAAEQTGVQWVATE